MRLLAIILAMLFAFPALGQAPPPVPPIADATRTVTYNITSSTAQVQVTFPVFGDCSDILVQINSVTVSLPSALWNCASASGSAISTLPLPITDMVINLTPPLTTGTLTITGAWHPRNLSVPSQPGLSRHEYEQAVSTLIASNREIFTSLAGLGSVPQLSASLGAPPCIGCLVPNTGAFLALSGTTLGVPGKSTLGASGWLTPIAPATESIATQQVLATDGRIAILGATRSSDNPMTGSMGSIAGAFFGINDNTAHLQTVHGLYSETRSNLNAGGATIGVEATTLSYGPYVAIGPYTMVMPGQTMGLWLGAGRPDVPAASFQISSAVGVINNGAQFGCGICFGTGSVLSGRAIDMPISYAIDWRNTTNFGASAIIRSDISDGTHGQSLIFNNAGFFIQDISAANIATFTLAQTTIQSTNGLATPAILCTGTAPTNTGTCAINNQTSGNTCGTFKFNGACASNGTVVLNFAATAPTNGWICDAWDLTTQTDTIKQNGFNMTAISLVVGTGANSGDLASFKCIGNVTHEICARSSSAYLARHGADAGPKDLRAECAAGRGNPCAAFDQWAGHHAAG